MGVSEKLKGQPEGVCSCLRSRMCMHVCLRDCVFVSFFLEKGVGRLRMRSTVLFVNNLHK